MHGKCSMAFVAITHGSTVELMKRIEPTLKKETCVVDWWFEPAPRFVVARNGFLDPLSSHVRDAWEEIRQRRQSKHMQQSKPFQRGVERPLDHRERSTVSQVFVEPRGVGQRTKDSDNP
jgi:hypothetical protein